MKNAKVRTTFNEFKQATTDGTDEKRKSTETFDLFKQATTDKS